MIFNKKPRFGGAAPAADGVSPRSTRPPGLRCRGSMHILRALSHGTRRCRSSQAIDLKRNRARLGEPSKLQTQDHSSIAAQILAAALLSVPSSDLATPQAPI